MGVGIALDQAVFGQRPVGGGQPQRGGKPVADMGVLGLMPQQGAPPWPQGGHRPQRQKSAEAAGANPAALVQMPGIKRRDALSALQPAAQTARQGGGELLEPWVEIFAQLQDLAVLGADLGPDAGKSAAARVLRGVTRSRSSQHSARAQYVAAAMVMSQGA